MIPLFLFGFIALIATIIFLTIATTKKQKRNIVISSILVCASLLILLITGHQLVTNNNNLSEEEDDSSYVESTSEEEEDLDTSKSEEDTSKIEPDTSLENNEKDSESESNIVGRDNSVYGKLTAPEAVNKSENIYKDESRDIIYTTIENKEIFQVDISFSDLPMDMNLDKDFLSEHAHDYMEKDVALISTKDTTHFIYESKSIDKKYEVIYQLDSDGSVIGVIISRFTE